jgi:hypothetical protein
MNSFLKGVITGAVTMLALVVIIAAFRFFHERDKKIYEYVEQQNAIQDLREDYVNRDPYEFLDTPGVRGAADDANADFRRKRDEAVQRFRNRLAD